ncbi:hypothetical protein DICVIV_00639 [Dictyocaulus viviparus]|uniref:Uncharacterized protein n=1 Tax=Dictyocaulus viviparus TaxID=29172 RepID=A0A0D8YER1_DICVI|nr:hypothetical protein DICVIV_00639 [Dictyocaulus viviparus]
MNSFRVEELVFTFHDLQPFSDVLYDEVQLNRLHKMFQVRIQLSEFLSSIPLWVNIDVGKGKVLYLEGLHRNCNSNLIQIQCCSLAEYCVDTLIPSERQIRRLHACVYKDGMTECFRKSPSVTEKQIKNLFDRVLPVLHRREILRTLVWMIAHDDTFAKMAVFDDVFSKSFDTTNELNSTSLTSIDVKIFRWLEMNVNHKAWATLYAATIVDSITRVYSCRQKCDDLFPDGIGRNIEFTVDEIDGIEEHVSRYSLVRDAFWFTATMFRYLASELLMRREFGKAEKKLLFASSIESKNLLIKSTLDKNLPQNESITQSPSTGSGKTLIDACTNTPTITNNSAYLTVGDENETFPSFMDEYATPDTTFTSTIDTPHGRNTSISSVSKSLNADRERQDAATTDYMSKSHTLSVSATGQVAFSGQTNSVPLNNVTNCHTLGISPFKTIGFNGFTGVEGCSSGQFVDGISTSFWKSKYNVSMPEKLGGSISVSDREKLPVHDCKRETDMMQDSTQPELLPFGRPLSCGTLRQFLNPPLEFLSKQCGDLRGIRILEDLATDTPEIPNSNLSMSCTAMEGGYSDDDNCTS